MWLESILPSAVVSVMMDLLKALFYFLASVNSLQGFLLLPYIGGLTDNFTRLFGWLGFGACVVDNVSGLLYHGMELTILCGSTSSSECFTVKGRRILEFVVLASFAIFFTGEYDLPLISAFLKTISAISLATLVTFHQTQPNLVEMVSTIYFPLTTGALIAVSSIADNGHLFWATFNTVLFDRIVYRNITVQLSSTKFHCDSRCDAMLDVTATA
ncbi:unnamed protein product, partial [Notodromas monacha]